MNGIPEILSDRFGLFYAFLRSDLTLDVPNNSLFRYLGIDEVSGPPLLADIFYETIGLESEIMKVLDGSSDEFCIPTVNRVVGTDIYFDLYCIPYPREERTALLVVKDATAEGLSLRSVQQRRNEAVLKNQELVSNEHFVRALLDMIPSPVYYKDDGGRYVGCNTAFEKFMSLTRDEIIGKTVHDIVEPKSSVFFSDRDEELMRDGGGQQFEAPVPGPDGVTRYVLFNRAVFPGADGAPGGIVGVISDITERRKMEEKLNQLGIAVEKSPATIMITDPEGRIVYVNRKFSDLTGYTAEEALGANPRILKSGHHTPAFYRNLWDTILGGREWRGEMLNRKKNGDLYWEMASISPIVDDGGRVTRFVAVKEDITGLKQAMDNLETAGNELRERNEMLQEDLMIAGRVVGALIQKELPVIEQCAMESRYLPFGVIGGDYYSIRPTDGGISIFICDISGHGVGSALFLSLIRYLSDQIESSCRCEPEKYLAELNEHLSAVMSSYFITGIYGFLSFNEGAHLRFANGGHPHPIVCRRDGGISLAGGNGPVMGIDPGLEFQASSVRLEPGDRVFFYTDGLPESRNAGGDELGFDDGLLRLFGRAKRGSLKETMDAVLHEIDLFRGSVPAGDDIVLIGLEVLDPGRA